MKKLFAIALIPLALAACTDGNDAAQYGTYNTPASLSEDSYLMAAAPKYYIGTPYQIGNTTYTPAEDMNYNETGIAGIVPDELNGVLTTNGETYSSDQMVATSKILPLPSIVQVTNLETGATAQLRVNNRGPFLNDRIMDVSSAAARALDMDGNTQVQVMILSDKSIAVKDATLGTATATTMNTNGNVTTATTTPAPAAVATGAGDYTVQLSAYYSSDSADALAQRIGRGATVVNEDGLYKVRIPNLDAASARATIDDLRNSEGMAPGLLKDGHWINADSI